MRHRRASYGAARVLASASAHTSGGVLRGRVEDPEHFTAPVTHRSLWEYRPELKPANLPCDPESARRFTADD